jgi:neutral ceramidase
MKARRLIAASAAGLLLVVITLAVVSLDRLDGTPLAKASYYIETNERWRAHSQTADVVNGNLLAGFGRALLSPVLDAREDDPAQGRFKTLPLAGYGGRKGQPATGSRDELFVKAAAFKVEGCLGVMVSADALIIPREVAAEAMERLERTLDLRREQVYFSATHTHSSLGGWGEGMVAEAFAGRFQPGVRGWFADRIVAAITEAVSDMAPAELGHGKFAATDMVRNRLVGTEGALDDQFSFVLVRRTDGTTAVLGSYAAHATVLSSRVMEFSGDYPGHWQRSVEQATAGPALFLAGAMGSHAPVPGKGGFEGAEAMGQALGRALLRELPDVQLTNTISFGVAGLEMTLPPLHARVSNRIRIRPWLARRFVPVSERTYLQVFRLNKAIWLSTPCDFSGELALEIKQGIAARGFQGVITSFNGDYIGYVVPSRHYYRGGYEPMLMSFHGPHLAGFMSELLEKMALHMAGFE